MLILLDLDGTLINDRGYRAAIDATIVRYAKNNGLPVFPPSDADVHLLHAHGYSNEWDSVAFLAGILHHALYTGASGRPDYQAWTRQTAGLPGLPNERGRDVLLRQSPSELQPLIHRLLDNVTDVENAVTTRLFAETILGSELFASHYRLPPALNAPSLLEALDEPLLDKRGRAVILARRSCVYTARPSLPPGHKLQQPPPDDGYAPVHPPEAEIGLRLLGLEHLPMMALGHVQWLADQHDERVYDLTKPSPVQALAAMLAAAGCGEHAALMAAYRLWKIGHFTSDYEVLDGEHVYVFEDNAGGVRACHTAAALLQRHGVAVTIHGMGIASAEAKRLALAPVCDAVFTNVNDGLGRIEMSGEE